MFAASQNVWRYGPATAALLPPASIYYLHAPHQYLAVWLRSLGRTPFIYDAHDFYPAGYKDSALSEQALWFRVLLWLERRAVRRAAEVITVADGCAVLMNSFFDRQPVVIPNVHDSRIDEPAPEGLRQVLGLDAEEFLLVMVGNEKPGTATKEALQAMTKLPSQVHLALVGRGWDVFATTISEYGLDGRVHLCGPLPPTQVVSFIAGADAAIVLYLPHTVDYLHALPNRLFLPIAAGLPVLYPRQLVEIRSIAEEHRLGLPLDPGEPDSIVDAISRLIEDDDLGRQAGRGFEKREGEPGLGEQRAPTRRDSRGRSRWKIDQVVSSSPPTPLEAGPNETQQGAESFDDVISPPSGKPIPDFRQMWAYRDVLLFLARRDIAVRYKQTVVGIAWAVLQPLMFALVLTAFLGLVFSAPSAGSRERRSSCAA